MALKFSAPSRVLGSPRKAFGDRYSYVIRKDIEHGKGYLVTVRETETIAGQKFSAAGYPVDTDYHDTLALAKAWAQAYEDDALRESHSYCNRSTRATLAAYA